MGAVVAATVITILIASGGVTSGIRSVGRVVVAPFAWTFSEIARPIADIFGGAVNYSSVVQQNHQLRQELALRSQQANQSAALEQQLQDIATTQHLTYIGNLDSVVAQVTTNSPTNFSASFTIAKGSLDGVLAGMPVVGNGGLIGHVVSTSAHTATVLMITDQTSIVGCTFGNGRTDVLIYGRGVNSPLAAGNVAATSPISPGTIFSTSGLEGGSFPPGLPVARARSVTITPGSNTYDLTLAPAANLSNLSYVSVLLWEPST